MFAGLRLDDGDDGIGGIRNAASTRGFGRGCAGWAGEGEVESTLAAGAVQLEDEEGRMGVKYRRRGPE